MVLKRLKLVLSLLTSPTLIKKIIRINLMTQYTTNIKKFKSLTLIFLVIILFSFLQTLQNL